VSVPRPSSLFRQSCLVLLLAVPFGAAAFAQKAAAATLPKYDPQTETKFKAIVEELKLPEKPDSKENVHLVVKEGEEVVDVTLCPKSFLDDMGVNFSKGDAVELTVSKVKAEGADLVLARQVTKGDDMLVLRDGKGAPIWNWKR
jgi:hypothetical protein